MVTMVRTAHKTIGKVIQWSIQNSVGGNTRIKAIYKETENIQTEIALTTMQLVAVGPVLMPDHTCHRDYNGPGRNCIRGTSAVFQKLQRLPPYWFGFQSYLYSRNENRSKTYKPFVKFALQKSLVGCDQRGYQIQTDAKYWTACDDVTCTIFVHFGRQLKFPWCFTQVHCNAPPYRPIGPRHKILHIVRHVVSGYSPIRPESRFVRYLNSH